MRYIDTGSRDAADALGTWLRSVDPAEVDALRVQSGFYSRGGLDELRAVLGDLRRRGAAARIVIGANEQSTLAADVEALRAELGAPRGGADLAVVCFAEGFFHPKTLHLARGDGSQAAYVGSANLTRSGVYGQHIEAGLLLDTREGDDADVVAAVGAAVDAWFDETRDGAHRIETTADVEALVGRGLLAEAPAPRAAVTPRTTSARTVGLTRLRPLLAARRRRPEPTSAAEPADAPHAGALVWRSNPLTRRDLNIPRGLRTHATGSMLWKKGAWTRDIDQRSYFREEVFADLDWHPRADRPHLERAEADFDLRVHGERRGRYRLTLGHNMSTTSVAYRQRNAMTQLHWGDMRPEIADEALIGSRLELYRLPPADDEAPVFLIDVVARD